MVKNLVTQEVSQGGEQHRCKLLSMKEIINELIERPKEDR